MHETDIIDTPAQKREAIEAHTKGEALIRCRIDAGVLEDVRVDHAGTHHFDPFVSQFFG